MVEETKSKDIDVNSPIRLLEIAIALGAEVLAPVGSHFFELIIFDNSYSYDKTYSTSIFQTKKSCETALVNWIVREWTESERTPWREVATALSSSRLQEEMRLIRESDDPFEAYLATHTDSEIIDWYFAQSIDTYEINRKRIYEEEKPFLGFKRKQ